VVTQRQHDVHPNLCFIVNDGAAKATYAGRVRLLRQLLFAQ